MESWGLGILPLRSLQSIIVQGFAHGANACRSVSLSASIVSACFLHNFSILSHYLAGRPGLRRSAGIPNVAFRCGR